MNSRLGWKIFATVFLLNALYVKSYVNDPMALSILDLTVSLVDRGRLDIDPYAGNSLDVAAFDGHEYSGMAPGVSILSLPYYVAIKPLTDRLVSPALDESLDRQCLAARISWRPSQKRMTILLLNALVVACGFCVLGGGMAVLFERVLRRLYPDLDESKRVLATMLFAVGTVWFFYTSAMEHRVVSTSLCFAAYALFLDPVPTRRRGLLAGLALGAAVATTYETVLVAMCVGTFGLIRWRGRWPWAATFLGATVVVGALMLYHACCFGRPWATPYAARLIVKPPAMMERPIGESLARALARPLGRAHELLFGSRYGFFFFSPVLILAVPALAQLRGRAELRDTAAMVVAIAGLLLGLHFFSGYDGAAGEFGFRFSVPVIPFMMLLIPLTFSWSLRLAIPLLVLASAIVLAKGQMFGAATSPHFWVEYGDSLRRFGLSTYTLGNIKEHVLPRLSPWVISGVHLGMLAAVLAVIRWGIWRRRSPNGLAETA